MSQANPFWLPGINDEVTQRYNKLFRLSDRRNVSCRKKTHLVCQLVRIIVNKWLQNNYHFSSYFVAWQGVLTLPTSKYYCSPNSCIKLCFNGTDVHQKNDSKNLPLSFSFREHFWVKSGNWSRHTGKDLWVGHVRCYSNWILPENWATT